MENNLSPHSVIHPPTPQPAPAPVSNLHMLYYGLAVVGTAAALLVLYNLVIIKLCSEHIADQRLSSMHPLAKSSWKHCAGYSIPSFKHYKHKADNQRSCGSDDDDDQCVVCLSMFEEGEELRRLPTCKHSFHASCIDMWLYSHVDCPLCRAPVFDRPTELNRPRQEILGPLAFV